MNFQPLGSGISWKDRTPSKVCGLSICFASVLCDLQESVKGLRYCFLKSRRFLRKAMLLGSILLTLSEMSLVYGLGVCLLRSVKSTGSRGVRASKPVKNLWKNGSFWLRYSFVTHSIYHKQGTEGTQEYFRSSLLSLQRFFSAGETRAEKPGCCRRLDSRASETRGFVKITPREKRRHVILKALEVLHNMQDSKASGFINSMPKFELPMNGCYNLVCLSPTIFKGLT